MTQILLYKYRQGGEAKEEEVEVEEGEAACREEPCPPFRGKVGREVKRKKRMRLKGKEPLLGL